MKLWVDDIRNAPDESWNVARTVTAAVRAIARFEFEEISLDHDISHQIHMDELSRPFPCLETFMPVVYFIAEKYWQDRAMPENMGVRVMSTHLAPKITLHTSNVVAADEMELVLKESGIPCVRKHMGLANRLEMEV